MKKKVIIGIVILIIVLMMILKIVFFSKPMELKKISVLVNREQESLFSDEVIKGIMRNEYHIYLECDFLDNIEIEEKIALNEGLEKYDAIFYSNNTNEEFISIGGRDFLLQDINFKSSIVIYSWQEIIDALIKEEIVTDIDDIYYATDMNKLLQYMIDEKKWEDIGLDNIYGNIMIDTTHIEKTQLGKDYYRFLVATLNKNTIEDNTEEKVQKLKNIYINSSLIMNNTSKSFFEKYLKEGMNVSPMIIGYERNLLDFTNKNTADYREMQDSIDLIYPEKTIFDISKVIILNDNGDKFLEIFENDGLQRMAWQNSGIRTDITKEYYTKGHQNLGIPENVNNIEE